MSVSVCLCVGAWRLWTRLKYTTSPYVNCGPISNYKPYITLCLIEHDICQLSRVQTNNKVDSKSMPWVIMDILRKQISIIGLSQQPTPLLLHNPY